MKYYPEVLGIEKNLPLKEFREEKEAIQFFLNSYGKNLLAVVLDNDPEIRVVWDRMGGSND